MQLDELDIPESTMNSANKVELFLNKFYSTLSSSYFTSLHDISGSIVVCLVNSLPKLKI